MKRMNSGVLMKVSVWCPQSCMETDWGGVQITLQENTCFHYLDKPCGIAGVRCVMEGQRERERGVLKLRE